MACLDGLGRGLSDAAIALLRDQLYAVAGITLPEAEDLLSSRLERTGRLWLSNACRLRIAIQPRASDLWVQASLDYRQRLQELLFPEGIAFDGIRFNRTAVTALLFRYLEPVERADSNLASPPGFEPGFQP